MTGSRRGPRPRPRKRIVFKSMQRAELIKLIIQRFTRKKGRAPTPAEIREVIRNMKKPR